MALVARDALIELQDAARKQCGDFSLWRPHLFAHGSLLGQAAVLATAQSVVRQWPAPGSGTRQIALFPAAVVPGLTGVS